MVLDKLKQLKGDDDTPSGTNGELEGFGNLFQEESPSRLIKAYSAVTSREEAYKKAVKDMKISGAPKFVIAGFSSTAWKKDILNRYNVVTKAEEIAKLTAIKAKLSKYQTEEQQLQSDMSDIADLLSK